MILIFDTNCGLCNQLFDIQCAVNFCITYNLKFSFRYCSFRDCKNLSLFFNKPFTKLFDDKLFFKFGSYINFQFIENKINSNNTYNINYTKRSIELFKNENEAIEFIKKYKNRYDYIVLPQFFSICDFSNQQKKYYHNIKPNPKLLSIFVNLKKTLLPNNYNFIHFRYENDFTTFFNINKDISIDFLLKNIKFQNKNLKIYIASSDIKKLSNTKLLKNNIYNYKNIVFKDDRFKKYNIDNLNFEEKAFIDLLIGINSEEVYGHSKSSFSSMLNMVKNTNNYYDKFL